jgi:hypothetical protein
MTILVLLVIIIAISHASPAVAPFLNANQNWIVGILGGIVGIAFIGALLQAFSR